jgi:glycerophosphoryl diester phosphodiesterase
MPEHLPYKLVAHRGYAGRFPENTLEAIQEAVNMGVNHVEFDVQFTGDGVPVMLHDSTLDRTHNNSSSIFNLKSEDLKSHAGLSSVEDVVVWLKENPEVIAFVELKTESIEAFGVEFCVKKLAEACAPVISRCVFISFDGPSCGLAKPAGFVKMGWVLPRYNHITLKVAQGLNPDYLFCDADYLPDGLEKLQEGSWEYVIYEVADKEVAKKLTQMGGGFIESKQLDLFE